MYYNLGPDLTERQDGECNGLEKQILRRLNLSHIIV